MGEALQGCVGRIGAADSDICQAEGCVCIPGTVCVCCSAPRCSGASFVTDLLAEVLERAVPPSLTPGVSVVSGS